MSEKSISGEDGVKVVHNELATSDEIIDPRPTTVYVNGAGTATLVDARGTSITYNLVVGQILPFSWVKFTAGTALLVGWN